MNMKYLAAAMLLCATTAFSQKRLIDDVNVFVGTDGFGNVYPGAQVPFGGIQISPDCDDKDYDCAAGYKYSKPLRRLPVPSGHRLAGEAVKIFT